MQDYERRHGMRFRVLVTHDVEDVLHPESLLLINWFSRRHAMVQILVLPLPTPAREWTHGLYCDEFAEYQTKDIPVRQRLGGFLPANGVGTRFCARGPGTPGRDAQRTPVRSHLSDGRLRNRFRDPRHGLQPGLRPAPAGEPRP